MLLILLGLAWYMFGFTGMLLLFVLFIFIGE